MLNCTQQHSIGNGLVVKNTASVKVVDLSRVFGGPISFLSGNFTRITCKFYNLELKCNV